MSLRLVLATVVVREYAEALDFFVGILGFSLVEDRDVPEQAKRWVVVAPSPDSACQLLLARASTDEQRQRIGSQTGGRVAFFLHTDDLDRDVAAWSARGVRFVRAPTTQEYGRVAVFSDLYGNLWDLIEPADARPD